MPVLKNARHERFAQELAKGKTADESYELAGYKPDRGHASRLAAKGSIEQRVAEIQQRGAERAAVTTESLILEAEQIRVAAMASGQLAAANGSVTLKARLAGKLIDRVETGKPGDFERMTDAELAAFIAREAGAVGLRNAGNASEEDPKGMRRQSRNVH